MTEQSFQKRVRINFSVSTKGVVTPDVTVEMTNKSNEEVLKEALGLLDMCWIASRERGQKFFEDKLKE